MRFQSLYKEFIYSVVDGDYLKEEEEEQPVDKPESGEETETDKTETDNKDDKVPVGAIVNN